jgi:RNA polymerase sigma factor (sigma-70 family)
LASIWLKEVVFMDYAQEYCKNYLEKVFYFCLRKTGSEKDAEDLAGDISLDILSAISKGVCIFSFQAWVWQIARNRYSKWVKEKIKNGLSVDIEDLSETLPDGEYTEEDIILSEDISLLRRELAFIRSDYRNIIVAHYLEDKSLPQIAKETGLPLGTVKTKLYNSRKQLKEGMNMAREFGKRSYAPEEITFISNMNKPGTYGEPWSVITKKLYKNILLEAYDNPSTAEQLSMELGVSMPYMEEELEGLVAGTFMVKTGDKYETNFPIISSSAQIKIHEKNKEITPELTIILEEIIETYHKACVNLGIDYYGSFVSYEEAKWTLLMRLYDKISTLAAYRVDKSLCNYTLTKRPNGGEWDIVGFQETALDTPVFVGLHGCFSDVDFGQYKFRYKDIYYRTPEHLTALEGESLVKVCKGQWQDVNKGVLDALESYGYIYKTENYYSPMLLVFTERLEIIQKRFAEEIQQDINAKTEKAAEVFANALKYCIDIIDSDLPAKFDKNAISRTQACSMASHQRGYAFEQALSDGWLKESSQKTLGAYVKL